MQILLILLFITGYFFIAVEQKTIVSKTAISLLLAAVCWSLNFIHFWRHDMDIMIQLDKHLSDTSQIIFFLFGTMSIVEIIDSYQGFYHIRRLIRVEKTVSRFWLIITMTFFLSSFLDNVTSSIILVSFMQKMIKNRENRLIFASMIIVAANAGGAWTPIGDVTTTMLWIKGYISTGPLMGTLLLPSLISMIVPLTLFTFMLKKEESAVSESEVLTNQDSIEILIIGIGALLLVPVLKALFDLPPYLAVLFGLSILWIYTDLIHKKRDEENVPRILTKIDLSTILFLFGILLTVSALETSGILTIAAAHMESLLPSKSIEAALLGIFSSIIDNVPLTAAAMGMYDISEFPINSVLWKMIAYCVGTGGSLLVIGSAAGVIVMGLEKISFLWYLKKVSFIVLLGYLAGFSLFLHT